MRVRRGGAAREAEERTSGIYSPNLHSIADLADFAASCRAACRRMQQRRGGGCRCACRCCRRLVTLAAYIWLTVIFNAVVFRRAAGPTATITHGLSARRCRKNRCSDAGSTNPAINPGRLMVYQYGSNPTPTPTPALTHVLRIRHHAPYNRNRTTPKVKLAQPSSAAPSAPPATSTSDSFEVCKRCTTAAAGGTPCARTARSSRV